MVVGKRGRPSSLWSEEKCALVTAKQEFYGTAQTAYSFRLKIAAVAATAASLSCQSGFQTGVRLKIAAVAATAAETARLWCMACVAASRLPQSRRLRQQPPRQLESVVPRLKIAAVAATAAASWRSSSAFCSFRLKIAAVAATAAVVVSCMLNLEWTASRLPQSRRLRLRHIWLE